jgi:hypothetical protein
MADIACCSGFEDWRFGFQAYVHSSTYTTVPLVDAPHIFWPTSATGGMISWIIGENGCNVSRVDIDRATYRGYFVYDYYNTDYSQWFMIIRQKRFDDLEDTLFASNWRWHADEGIHFQYPAIAANESNVLIVAEIWDETTPDDKDIYCISTANGDLEQLDSVTVVAGTADAERYPEIEPISGTTFLCTFIKNNTLYGAISADGGINWSDPPIQLSEVGDSVVNDYQAHKITESDGYLANQEPSETFACA